MDASCERELQHHRALPVRLKCGAIPELLAQDHISQPRLLVDSRGDRAAPAFSTLHQDVTLPPVPSLHRGDRQTRPFLPGRKPEQLERQH